MKDDGEGISEHTIAVDKIKAELRSHLLEVVLLVEPVM